MNASFEKNIVKKRFEKSILTYEKNALVQAQMAEKLVDRLSEVCNTFGKVLELGCGTGLLTKKIVTNFTFNQYLANDIAESFQEYIKAINADIEYIQGDIEELEFQNSNDLIVSNAVFQWVQDIERFSEKLSSIAKQDGILAFSTFGAENLKEIAFLTGNKLDYIDFESLKNLFSNDFELLFAKQETVTLEFGTGMDVLKHLKNTGVNSLNQRIWTKKSLKSFCEDYKREFSQNGKLPLTYNPMYFIFKKI